MSFAQRINNVIERVTNACPDLRLKDYHNREVDGMVRVEFEKPGTDEWYSVIEIGGNLEVATMVMHRQGEEFEQAVARQKVVQNALGKAPA